MTGGLSCPDGFMACPATTVNKAQSVIVDSLLLIMPGRLGAHLSSNNPWLIYEMQIGKRRPRTIGVALRRKEKEKVGITEGGSRVNAVESCCRYSKIPTFCGPPTPADHGLGLRSGALFGHQVQKIIGTPQELSTRNLSKQCPQRQMRGINCRPCFLQTIWSRLGKLIWLK